MQAKYVNTGLDTYHKTVEINKPNCLELFHPTCRFGIAWSLLWEAGMFISNMKELFSKIPVW